MPKITMLNRKTLLLIVLPMLNLLFMHYYFYFSSVLEWTWLYSEIINLCGVVFDVSVLTIISLLITRGKVKLAIAITQVVTLLWSFINVMYGKFFFQYMSLSAIGEVHGLREGLVINSILSAFYWYDVYYVLSAITFIVIYRNCQSYFIPNKVKYQLLAIPVSSLVVPLLIFSIYHFLHPNYRNNWELYELRVRELFYDSMRGGTPNLDHFQTGCIRVAIYELYDMFHKIELTEEQRREIEKYYNDHSLRTTQHERNPKIKNVVFILLESFLSAPIDLIVDGKEITPFLNSLKKDSNVYYNSNMISDISCGESGDGQFIYMTGLLPLKHKMTVGKVKNNVLPSLPKILKEELNIRNTEIIFPTMPNLWQQADMNIAYEIETAYSLENIIGNKQNNIDDQDIFNFASKSIEVSKMPFFLLILSISTHSPYGNFVGKDLGLTDCSLSTEYKNYLYSCHLLDSQLKLFFTALKSKGVLDNSLVVIASDHYAHLNMLNMEGKITNHCPLFIVNGGIQKDKMWNGEFHQVDVYTTLLDLLAVNQKWLGMGHTLLSPLYKESVNAKTYYMSELIIDGNYFAN